MSVTVKDKKGLSVPGDLWYTIKELTLDNSYANGGEPVTLQELGFGPEAVFAYAEVQILSSTESEAQPIAFAIYDGSKIHVFDGKTQKEVAETKDLSKVKLLVITYCTAA